jgi:hypothetical protein
MSIALKQLGLTDFFEGSKSPDTLVSFTEKDSEAIHEELFSGKSGEEAREIMLRIILGRFEDEQEKEKLIDRYRELCQEAVLTHLEDRPS